MADATLITRLGDGSQDQQVVQLLHIVEIVLPRNTSSGVMEEVRPMPAGRVDHTALAWPTVHGLFQPRCLTAKPQIASNLVQYQGDTDWSI